MLVHPFSHNYRAADFDGLNIPSFNTRDEACGQILLEYIYLDKDMIPLLLSPTSISPHEPPYLEQILICLQAARQYQKGGSHFLLLSPIILKINLRKR